MEAMPIQYSSYSALLNSEKWISKTDFIYRVKVNCDSAREDHSRFLRFLYQFRFSMVKKGSDGHLLFL